MADLQKRFNPAVTALPDELSKIGESDNSYINGRSFKERVLDAQQNGEFERAGFTPDQVNSLKETGKLLSKNQNVLKFNAITQLIAKAGLTGVGGGKLAKTAKLLGAASGGKWTGGKVVAKIMTTPKAIETLNNGLRAGASAPTISKVLAVSLASQLRDEGITRGKTVAPDGNAIAILTLTQKFAFGSGRLKSPWRIVDL